MPGGWADGWLRPTAGGPDVPIRLQGTAAGRVYFTSRPGPRSTGGGIGSEGLDDR